MSLPDVIAALEPLRNRYTAEAPLQAAIAALFGRAGVQYEREFRLTKHAGRIDFVCFDATIGVEVKVAGSALSHARQLYRYAPFFQSLVLVTTCSNAPPAEPLVVDGRECPLHIISLNLRL